MAEVNQSQRDAQGEQAQSSQEHFEAPVGSENRDSQAVWQ